MWFFNITWEQRKLSDIAERYDHLRIPVAENLRAKGTTPYYGANGIQDYVDGFTHNGEFVLIAEDGANDINNYPVHYVNGKVWVNNHAHVVSVKENLAVNKFLLYAFPLLNIRQFLVGGSRAKLNAGTMMELSLFIPCKKEQKTISNVFFELDNLITLHQRKLEKLKNVKKACLKKMFV